MSARPRLRDPVNGLTHAVGAVLALIVLGALTIAAGQAGKPTHVVSFAVFGASLVALYASSALYHLLPLAPAGVARLRLLDHAMIYILIAGTYTPVCLIALQGGARWGLLSVVWSLAVLGATLKLGWRALPRWLSTVFYVLMGWCALGAAPWLLRMVPAGALWWIVAGGVAYTAGACVYALRRPTLIRGVIESHELWHLFVLLGSACHVWAMLRYIAPLP